MSANKFSILFFFCIFLIPFILYARIDAPEAKIYGTVTDAEGKPINGANIVIEGTIDGSTTDAAGCYEFETSKIGSRMLIFTALEFNEKKVPVQIEAGKQIEVNVKLSKEEVVTDEIIVTASSYTSGQNSQVTLTPLEIVRIPGADADIYRAITTFPGSNQVNEGSEITVRGGDANEVTTILDQATLYNPFIFQDDFNTSSFSTINVWGLRGINFSSGGFGAKYGNALSAVLDLKSYDMPSRSALFAFIGLAYSSLTGTYLSENKKFGFSYEGSQTFLEPYFYVNNRDKSEYSPLPAATTLGGTLSCKFNSTTYLKIYGDYQSDKIGIRSTSPSYDGFYNSSSNNYFSNVKLSTSVLGSSLLSTGVSFSRHNRDINYGVLNTNNKDIYSKFRVDLNNPLSSKIELNTGAEYEYNEKRFNGTVPVFDYNLRPGAPSMSINYKKIAGRLGAYSELQYKPDKKFFAITGIRTDYHTLSKKISFDPRLSLGYKLAADNTLRAAIGIYHQYPELQYYAQTTDNNLNPEEAIHYILGYEINKMDGLFLFRIEVYYKDYKNLVLYDKDNCLYYSGGNGFARGIDMFLKSKLSNKYTVWISYSYTDSKRRQYGAMEETSANYDITHNLSFVGSYNITDNLMVGATYKISTGKPYTPVIGSVYDSTQGLYIPINGETNSDRYPTYQRFDINAQYYFSLFGKFAVIAFVLNNLLNQKNLYGYTYNSDYTKRIEIISNNRRSIFIGFGLQL